MKIVHRGLLTTVGTEPICQFGTVMEKHSIRSASLDRGFLHKRFITKSLRRKHVVSGEVWCQPDPVKCPMAPIASEPVLS